MRGALLLAALTAMVLATGRAEAGICTLIVLTPGILALSADGTRIGSEEPGGLSATMTVGSIGPSTLTVAAPTVIQAPPGYSGGSQLVEVAYQGTGLLASASQPYTSLPTSVPVPNIVSAVAVTIDNRVSNAAGFAAGTYQTRTVVTCS